MTDPLDEFSELSQFTVDPRSVRLLKQPYCAERYAVVLGTVDRNACDAVTVGVLDPSDRTLAAELALLLKRPVQPVRLNSSEIRKAIDIGYPFEDERDTGRVKLKPARELSSDPDTAVTQVLSEILSVAVGAGASDIHIETYEDDVDVRLRIDGILRHIATHLSRDNIAAAMSRLKILSGLDIAERRLAQDGRIQAVYSEKGGRRQGERRIDFRVSVVPGPFGEDAVLRVLETSRALRPLEELGFGDDSRLDFERLINNPEGLVLVTGPTGSGKTTTLYAAISRLNTPTNKILTVEDPIEYVFDDVNQKQITSSMGFADYARAFMRQNPDVILIGEIRDEETADVALRAAQTGHLVLSTLHTGDAVRSVSRLHTLGIGYSQLAGSLLGAVSQRLVRKLCPQCRSEAPPSAREERWLQLAPGDRKFFVGHGCDACRGKGYSGRIGLYEMFVIDEETADRIAEGAPIHEIRRLALAKGLRSLSEDALAKARAGVTSLAEVLRVVPYRLIAADRRHQ